jgi:peptide/nickel transport system substrate-binding protein
LPAVTPTTSGDTLGTTTTLGVVGKPYGGEVAVGVETEPTTLNIFLPGGENNVVRLLGQSYWTGVWDIDGETLEMVPDVVTELPTVANGGLTINPDGTETIEYHIRPEAVWADGTPISGNDFRFTYETIMNPDYPTNKLVYRDILSDSIEVGPKTFRYTLAAPTIQAELLFGVILPEHDVAGKDFLNDFNDSTWMSGGPFEFERWEKGDYLSVTRNPGYWGLDSDTGQQLPYLERVVFRFVGIDYLVTAFTDRQVDVIDAPPTEEAISELHALEPQGAEVQVRAGQSWEFLWFEFGDGRLAQNPGSYNSHLNFRRAVAHAIDKQAIVADLFGDQVAPMSSFVDAFSPSHSQESWDRYDYDPGAARSYLADLCAEDGVDCAANPPKIVFSTSGSNEERVRVSQLLAPMFAAVGIGFEVELQDSIVFFGDALDFGAVDVAEFGLVGAAGYSALASQLAWWDPAGAPPVGQNYWRWGTPAVSGEFLAGYNQGASSVQDEATQRFAGILADLSTEVDPDALLADVLEAEAILSDQVVFIPLYQRPSAGAVWSDTVAGYLHNPSGAGSTLAGDTWNIEDWYRVDLAQG